MPHSVILLHKYLLTRIQDDYDLYHQDVSITISTTINTSTAQISLNVLLELSMYMPTLLCNTLLVCCLNAVNQVFHDKEI